MAFFVVPFLFGDLSLKELDIIAKTILETLNGIFHSRIEYPTEIKKKVTS